MQILIALAFIAIIASLGAALFFMMRGGGTDADGNTPERTDAQRNKGMARALAVRVGVSVVLFICVLLAWKLGYIQPHGLPTGK
jgi:formate hydrogenlyase subunit 3/multisubunit Na+/H+ antiporter MnhD subunit